MKTGTAVPTGNAKQQPRLDKAPARETTSAQLTAEVERLQREEQTIINQRRAEELAKQRELARFD